MNLHRDGDLVQVLKLSHSDIVSEHPEPKRADLVSAKIRTVGNPAVVTMITMAHVS